MNTLIDVVFFDEEFIFLNN